MDGLEMPPIGAGGCVQRDDRVAEKIRACAIDADEVGRRRAHRKEDETPRRIGCDRRPDVRRAGRSPGAGRPRLCATLAVTWNRQTSRPLRASYARTAPDAWMRRISSQIDEPTITTSPTTVGGEVSLYSQGSVTFSIPSRRSTSPLRPKSAQPRPVAASSEIRRASSVARNTRRAHVPSCERERQ